MLTRYTFRADFHADILTIRFYIPFVRTLLPASTGTVPRKCVYSTVHEVGNEMITEFVEQVPHERVLKYLPIGNYKWYVFTLPPQKKRKAQSFHT